MRTATKSIDLIRKKQIFTCRAHFWAFLCANDTSVNSSCAFPPFSLPWLLRGSCPPCQSRGWGTANFPLPGGRAFAYRTFDTLVFSYQNITTQRILLEKQADWLICQGREIVKACSRFYACTSSLLIKPELHGKTREL